MTPPSRFSSPGTPVAPATHQACLTRGGSLPGCQLIGSRRLCIEGPACVTALRSRLQAAAAVHWFGGARLAECAAGMCPSVCTHHCRVRFRTPQMSWVICGGAACHRVGQTGVHSGWFKNLRSLTPGMRLHAKRQCNSGTYLQVCTLPCRRPCTRVSPCAPPPPSHLVSSARGEQWPRCGHYSARANG
jgi:hypothetical protein